MMMNSNKKSFADEFSWWRGVEMCRK
ncbi:hypothetical protein A2U01_0064644, partial [Trifolium medium]|nr:hypothetical protein [Trifolium medium]